MLKLNIKEIVNKLDHIISTKYQDAEKEIIGLEKINKNESNISPNILYYCGHSNNLDQLDKLDKYYNLILEENLTDQIDTAKIDNVIVVKSQKINSVLETIQNIINKRNFLDYVKKTLYEKAIENADIQTILKTAHNFLDNPIIVADSTYRLLGCYPQKKLGDQVWDKLYEQGFVNQNHMRKFDVDKTLEKLLKSNKPIILNWGFAEKTPRLSIKIQKNDRFFATMGVLKYNRDFLKQDYEVVKILADVLLSLMTDNNLPSDRLHIIKQSLLANLLDGGISSKRSLQKTMQNIDLKMKDPYYILSCRLANIENNILEKFHKDLTYKINNIQILTHKENFVLFIYNESNIDQKLEKLREIFEKYDVSFGLSNKFNNLLDTFRYYQQATRTIKVGKKLDDVMYIYQFKNYAEDCLIEDSITKDKLVTFIHPGIKKLIQYDKQNDTKFAVTLYNFLKNYKKANETAQNMHIHRNTLTYRLNKSQEIGNFDLDDNNECRYLQLSLKISDIKNIECN